MIIAETKFLKKVSKFEQINNRNCLFLNRYLNPSIMFGVLLVGSRRSLMNFAPSVMKMGPKTPMMIAINI